MVAHACQRKKLLNDCTFMDLLILFLIFYNFFFISMISYFHLCFNFYIFFIFIFSVFLYFNFILMNILFYFLMHTKKIFKKKIWVWPVSAIARKKNTECHRQKETCKKSAAYVCHRPGCIVMPMQMWDPIWRSETLIGKMTCI